MIRDNLPLHNKVCALRKHTCKHCKSEVTYKEMTGGHLDGCPDFEVPCFNYFIVDHYFEIECCYS